MLNNNNLIFYSIIRDLFGLLIAINWMAVK